MKLEYKSYTLEIEEIYQGEDTRIVANCDKICYAINTSKGYDYVIPEFRRKVNEYIQLWKREDDQRESERDTYSFWMSR